jgi:DNA-binding beta-propeller fold protein YncE
MTKSLKVLFWLLVMALMAFAVTAQPGPNPPLKLIQKIPVPSLEEGSFDHFGVDVKGKRLFSCAEKHGTVEVFDMATNKHIQTIGQGVIQEPHSLLYREDLDRLYVVDGNHEIGAVRIYDGKTYNLIKSIDLPPLADWSGYDPATKYLYINGNGREVKKPYSTVSIVDTTSGGVVGQIQVDDDVITDFALEPSNPNIYTGMRNKKQVGVIDRTKREVVATWPLHLGEGMGHMGLDPRNHRLFVNCRYGQMVIFDTQTGKELQSIPINQYSDELRFDEATKRLYVVASGAIGVGHPSVEVFQQVDPDHYNSLGEVTTEFGARNGILVPELHRFYVAAPKHGNNDAQILVYEVL